MLICHICWIKEHLIKTPGKTRGSITQKNRGFSCRKTFKYQKDVRKRTVQNFLYAGFVCVREREPKYLEIDNIDKNSFMK